MLGAGLVLGPSRGSSCRRGSTSPATAPTPCCPWAGAVGVATVAGLAALTGLAPVVCLGAGVAAFGRGPYLFAGAFRRSSGGSLFRIKNP